MTTKLVKWASNDGLITRSELSDGRRAKFFPSVAGWPTIGSDLTVIWEMSGKISQFCRL